MRYIFPCLLFLLNDEVFSLLALMILFILFLLEVWKAKDKYKEDEA